MQLCTETETDVIDALDTSICEVFTMMAGGEIQKSEETVREVPGTEQITVVMGLTGDLQGSLSLTMSDKSAIRWTQCLLDIELDEVDQDVVDAIGELGNMVVGGAKRRLEDFKLKLSLPSVIRAGTSKINFPSSLVPLELSFLFEGRPITVLIALNANVPTS